MEDLAHDLILKLLTMCPLRVGSHQTSSTQLLFAVYTKEGTCVSEPNLITRFALLLWQISN